jgi:hypothetical protein
VPYKHLAGIIAPLSLVIAACASSSGAISTRDCVLAPADSVYMATAAVYHDCAVDTPAKAITNRVEFTPSMNSVSPPRPGTSTCYFAEIQFVVGTDGRPEKDTIRLLRGTEPFARAVVESVPAWLYSPAMFDGAPVRQIVRERRTAALAVAVVSTSQARPPATSSPPNCR